MAANNKNSNKPAQPFVTKNNMIYSGLTKREYFAALAMQGIVGSIETIAITSHSEQIARNAVKVADALLTELDKTE